MDLVAVAVAAVELAGFVVVAVVHGPVSPPVDPVNQPAGHPEDG